MGSVWRVQSLQERGDLICQLVFSCSTITTWGQEGEYDAFKNMLTKFPTGLVAVVSDSYNLWNACEHVWGEQLKECIEKRGDSGTLIVRPDSGNPPEIVVKVGADFVRVKLPGNT